jgi:beta-lactamase class A
MLPFAPVTSQHLQEGGMTVAALAEAAQLTSDNVAANLPLGRIDGPAGVTRRLREIGDQHTRLGSSPI